MKIVGKNTTTTAYLLTVFYADTNVSNTTY